MEAHADLDTTESKVFRAYWQDGLLDLLAGSCAVLIGVGWLVGFVLAGVVVPPVALATWPLLRKRVTSPRLGEVRFNARRRFRMRHGLIAVTSLGVLLCGFVAVRVTTGQDWEFARWIAPGIPGLILAALALSAAEALRIARFVAYACAFVVAALLVAVLDADPGWAIAAGGAVAVVNGARLLARFLRRFPVLQAEMDQ